jgi:CBS domain containing-hemolysin-like protein
MQFQDMVDFIGGKTSNNDLSEGGEIPSTTVGNWVMETKGSLPRVGEQFDWQKLRIRVSRVQRHCVMEVIVTEIKT